MNGKDNSPHKKKTAKKNKNHLKLPVLPQNKGKIKKGKPKLSRKQIERMTR